MDILLDTHIWIWSVVEKSRLRNRVLAALENPANRLLISPISVWEALLLFEKGRVEVDVDPAVWVRQVWASGFYEEAPLTNEVAIFSRVLKLRHDDPADRFIAATAMVNGYTLATADQHLLKSPGIRTLPNR